jgi:hypothetical protein
MGRTRHLWLWGMLAGATLGLASPVESQTREGPEASSLAGTAGQVDLSGIGRVNVETDDALFAPFSSYILQRFEPDVFLYFDAAGRPSDCKPIATSAPAAFVEVLCRELLAKARLVLPAGYDLAGQRGFVPVYAMGGLPRLEAVEPVTFDDREASQAVEVFTAAFPIEGDSRCLVLEADLGAGLSEKSKQAICAAFLSDSARAGQSCARGGVEREVVQRWRCAIRTRPAPVGATLEITLRDRAVDPGQVPNYPPFALPDDRLLPPGAVRLRMPMSADDYPLWALRNEWAGPSEILIGVEHGNPRVLSCRPIQSSGYPLLDNTACRIALARGRVAFPDGQEFDGKRYHRQVIDWRL